MNIRKPSPLVLLGAVLLLATLLAAALGQRGLMALSACVALAVFTTEGFLAAGLNRVGLALLIAPLASCVVLALSSPQEWWFLPSLLYSYMAGLLGIPAYFVFRKLGWLSLWKVVCGGAALGALATLLLVGWPPIAPLLRGIGLGALVAAVFWAIAFTGRAQHVEA